MLQAVKLKTRAYFLLGVKIIVFFNGDSNFKIIIEGTTVCINAAAKKISNIIYKMDYRRDTDSASALAAPWRSWTLQVLWRILPAEHGSAPGQGGLPQPAARRSQSRAAIPRPGHPVWTRPRSGSTGPPKGLGECTYPETLYPPLCMSRVEMVEMWTVFDHTRMCTWE